MSKTYSYLLAGCFLSYYALSDDNFVIWYNGIALVLGISAFFAAYLEYKKGKKTE